MRIEFKSNNTILYDVPDFNLDQTFSCGQCFRWNNISPDTYIGVAFGRVLKITQNDGKFIMHNTSVEDFNKIWNGYFDIPRNYGEIKKSLAIDSVMEKAIASGGGIRILRQDVWETIISFIISSSNNIPRIKKIITALCENFGEPLEEGLYSFPSPENLRGITEDDLAPIRAGYRAKYMVDAVNKVLSGDVDISSFDKLDTDSVRQELLKINGIGNKVADCILLFGLGRTDVFPVDVWINNTMCKLYPDRCTSLNNVRLVGRELFGNYCGIAQQYLFYYARENGGNI
ncbi:MAG: DNA glycosylase [Monoglobales bacterium]